MTGHGLSGLHRAIAAAILPDRADTQLLRACLLDGEAARHAWTDWSARVGNPKRLLEQDGRGLKGLLPLIDHAARTATLAAAPELRTYLKAGVVREDLRARIIRGVLVQTREALAQDSLPFIMLGGMVSAHTVYAHPELRHCHAIDLLVEDTAGFMAPLARAGFTPATRHGAAVREFRHANGLTLNLRHDIAFHPHHQRPDGGVAARAVIVDIDGAAVRAACPADQFLMALSRAASSRERGNLRWAFDAWLTAPTVDWAVFMAETSRRHLALPVALLCHYLVAAMDAAIPETVVQQLELAAAQADPLDREAALAGALTGLGATRRALSAPGIDTGARLEIARFLALPSPRCLAWRYGPAGGVQRTLQRLHRPLHYVATRTRQRFAAR